MRKDEFFGKKKFANVAFNLKDKAFKVYIASISYNSDIHLFWKVWLALLKGDEIPTSVSPKYTDFINVFSKDLAPELPEHTRIHNHAINLIKR